MFSTSTIYSLVDILFKDMYNDYKTYEEAMQKAIEKLGLDEDIPEPVPAKPVDEEEAEQDE